MKNRRETFHKAERLCKCKVDILPFRTRECFPYYSFQGHLECKPVDLPYPAQAAFSVPKKSFRLAVTRNLIKRRMREAYLEK